VYVVVVLEVLCDSQWNGSSLYLIFNAVLLLIYGLICILFTVLNEDILWYWGELRS
jgi:hypothetical protein